MHQNREIEFVICPKVVGGTVNIILRAENLSWKT